MVLTVSMAFLALMAGAAAAGDYHSGTQLLCSDCHTMHASQQHSFAGVAGLQSWTPTAYLLKGADVCSGCHDGSAAGPDVIAANFNGAYVREAGALSTTTSAAPYEIYKGHTIGATTDPPGGGTAIAAGLQCVNCHDMHGSPGAGATDVAGNAVTSAYRNVKLNPAGTGSTRSVSYAIGTNDGTKDVFETSAALGTYSTHYAYTNVNFNRPSASASGLSEWCSTCHPNFHGDEYVGGGTTGFIRHPVAGKTIGAVQGDGTHTTQAQFYGGGTKTNWVKVMSPNGAWAPGSAAAVDGQPFCLSCHKAHGNQNPFGLIQMQNTGTITEEGTATGAYQDLCRQCHVQ